MTLKEIQAPKTKVKFTNILYVNGKWIFPGYLQNEEFKYYLYIYVSEDLKTFEKLELTNSYFLGMYANFYYANGFYILESDEYMYKSTDLITWTNLKDELVKVDTTIDDENPTLKFLNGQFYLTFADNRQENIYISSDLKNWTKKVTFSEREGIALTPKIITSFYEDKFYYYEKGIGTFGLHSTKDFKTENFVWGFNERYSFEDVITLNTPKGILVGLLLNSEDGSNLYVIKNDKLEKEITIPNLLQEIFYSNGIYIFKTNAAVYYSTDLEKINLLFETPNFVEKEFLSLDYSNEQKCFLLLSRNIYGESDYLEMIDVSRELASYQSNQNVFYIYDLNLDFVGIIDSFKSLRWRRKYFEAGEFEIVVPYDEKTIEYFKLNNLIIRNDYTEAGIIETIKKDDNGTDEDITLVGRFLSSILDRRIVKSTINFKGSTIDGMKALLNKMTPFPNFEIEKTCFDSTQVEFQCTYKNVYDYLIKLSKYSNVGFRVVPNLEYKVFVFENYQGKDRTWQQKENERYSFSDFEYNIDTATLTTSNTSKVNYALVGGQGEGADRILVEAKNGDYAGFDLYETFVDKKDISQDELTLDEYKNSLLQEGNNILTDNIESFEFSVNTDDYKNKFDLGDIVNVAKNRWGYSTVVRIIEAEEVIEDGNKTVSLVVGTPLPEILTDE